MRFALPLLVGQVGRGGCSGHGTNIVLKPSSPSTLQLEVDSHAERNKETCSPHTASLIHNDRVTRSPETAFPPQ